MHRLLVAGESPRPLDPHEKARLAALVRFEHSMAGERDGLQAALGCPHRARIVDAHIRDAIEASEADASMRVYLLTLASHAGSTEPLTVAEPQQ